MVRTWTKNLILTAAGCAVVFLFCMTSKGTPQTAGLTTREIIERFNEAFNRHDADALEAMFTDDTVFENTSPAPDGKRIEGKAAVVAYWREWFKRKPDARFDEEEMIVAGDRAVGLPQDARWKALALARRGRVHRARWEGCRETRLCEGVSVFHLIYRKIEREN